MKLIIDIHEEAYGEIVSQVANGITNPLKICIANGTPIPGNSTVLNKDDFIYLIKTCEYIMQNGQVMYEENDLIKRFSEYQKDRGWAESEDKDKHFMPIQFLTCNDINDIIDES